MITFIFNTKVFAVTTLIFLNSLSAAAQVAPVNVLPEGTRIRVRMDTEVNSKVASAGDTFLVRTVGAVRNRGVLVLPGGAVIEARITAARHAAIGGSDGMLEMRFERLRIGRDDAIPMNAVLAAPLKKESRSLFNLVAIAGATAAGALIGTASDTSNGVAIGALVGAGAGAGVVLLRKGGDVRIKTDEDFDIELKRELVLPTTDY
jgi:hypothetical protein